MLSFASVLEKHLSYDTKKTTETMYYTKHELSFVKKNIKTTTFCKTLPRKKHVLIEQLTPMRLEKYLKNFHVYKQNVLRKSSDSL